MKTSEKAYLFTLRLDPMKKESDLQLCYSIENQMADAATVDDIYSLLGQTCGGISRCGAYQLVANI